MEKYVAYYRISKENKEGRYLGIEAQRQIVEHFYKKVERIYIEIKSGKNITEREELQKAIEYCKKNNCILVCAKLDRLSRDVDDVRYILRVLKNNVRFCDIPGIPDKFTVTMYAAFAERERELIGLRTKQALKQKVKLTGEFRTGNPSFKDGSAVAKSSAVLTAKAENNPANKIAANIICSETKNGLTLQQIADKLQLLGCTTSKGNTNWTITQVARIRNKFCK